MDLMASRNRLFQIRSPFTLLVAFIVTIKLVLATITPFGYDYVAYMVSTIMGDTTLSWSPWIVFTRSAYAFWLWLPVDHGDFLRAISTKTGPLLPSHYLLTALIKTPLLVTDLAVAYMIRNLSTRLGQPREVSRKAALLWLANPFATLFVEMWGSMEVIVIFLSLASVTLAIASRQKFAAVALASGIALKLSPIIAWMSLTAWMLRRPYKPVSLISVISAGPIGFLGYFYWVSRGQIQASNLLFLSFNSYSPVTQMLSEYTSSSLYHITYPPGFAVVGVVAYYMILGITCAREDWTLVTLTLSGTLLGFGLADWFPTVFLIAMPLMALWNAKSKKHQYPLIFFALLSIYLLTFYDAELTSTSLSVLFIPMSLVPYATQIVAAIQSASSLVNQAMLGFEIRSIFAGFSIAYAASTTWSSLRRRRC